MFGRVSYLRALTLNSDRIRCHCGELGGGTQNLGKRLEWKDHEETWWEKISRSLRCVIDITGTDPLSLGEFFNSGKLEK